jgi:hypothetical protein
LLRQSIKKSAGVHDDTTLLLGLEGVVVDRVELDPDGCRVVHVSTAPRAKDAHDDVAAVCPSCRTPATSVKGWVSTRPRDVALPVPGPAGVAQAAVALPHVGMCAVLVPGLSTDAVGRWRTDS